MTAEGRILEAVSRFKNGYACSQAIFTVYAPQFGVAEDKALAIACGFAGGMRMAETCGAVSGAFMILGLKYCGAEGIAMAGRQATYEAVIKFTAQFKSKQHSVACKELLGYDVSTPEGHEMAVQQGLFRSACPLFVQHAAELLEKVI